MRTILLLCFALLTPGVASAPLCVPRTSSSFDRLKESPNVSA